MTDPLPDPKADPMAVKSGENGLIRVFGLNMRPEQAKFLKEPGAAAQVLGVDVLDPGQVDIFPVSDLEELGLATYLADGCGIPEAQIAPDRDRLKALDGWVMVIRSRAFGGRAMVLKPAKTLTLIGTYSESGTDWSARHLMTESARPGTGPRRSPRAARSRARRIGASIFAVVMLVVALIVLMVAL